MQPNQGDLQTRQLRGPEEEDSDYPGNVNVVHARVAGWQAHLQWRSRPRDLRSAIEAKAIVDRPKRRFTTLALLAVFFTLGAVVALGTVWEVVPYVEATRVVGELARFKPGGVLCLIAGIVLYLIRKSFRH